MTAALLEGNTAQVLNMLNCGFPPNSPLKVTVSGEKNETRTFIAHIAAEKGLLSVIKHISEYRDTMETRNSSGQTPFLVACKSGEFEVIRYLALRVRVDRTVQDYEGNTALHLAVQTGSKDLTQYLLEELQLDPAVRNLACETPADLCTRLIPTVMASEQLAYEEITAILRAKTAANPPLLPIPSPHCSRNGSQPARSRSILTPLSKQSLAFPALRPKLRSITPVDKLIRERCQQVFFSIQQKKKTSPLKRLKPLYGNPYTETAVPF